MRRYGAALFDLDGTVIDSGLGITNSVMYALRRCGRPVPERSELYSFVGPPLYDSFERYCGFSKEDAREAVRLYREYYREKGIFEFDVFRTKQRTLPKIVPVQQNLSHNDCS